MPLFVTLLCSFTIPETPRYTMDIERNVAQATQDIDLFYSSGRYSREEDAPVLRVDAPKATRHDFITHFSKWENGKILLGTAWSWFALDIAFFGLGLNSSIILHTIGYGKPDTNDLTCAQAVWRSLYNISTGNLILSAGGLLPGYYATFLLVDSVGDFSLYPTIV